MVKEDVINELQIESCIENKEYWHAIAKCKEEFINNGVDPRKNPLVRPEIAEAWIISKSYGVKPTDSHEPYLMDNYSLQEAQNKNKLLTDTAGPLIEVYEKMAISSGFSLEMFDPSGSVIMGSRINLPQSTGKNILGIKWDVTKTGMLSHHLAVKYKKPIHFIGPENYLDSFKNTISFASPILDQDGESIGAIAIWKDLGDEPWTDISVKILIHTMGWVHTLAAAIEKQLNLAKYNQIIKTTLELIDEAIITVTKTGKLISANQKGKKLFNIDDISDVSINILDHFSETSTIVQALSEGKQTSFVQELLLINNEETHFMVSINPVSENKDYDLDIAVLRFIPQIKFNNLIAQNTSSNAFFSFDEIIGQSPAIMEAKKAAMRFANSMENILLLGESGTGKEMFAQAIHNTSCPSGPFIALNCAVMPRNIIESELFGYESGTFTGADKNGKPGKIELADGGTLFLDEIGDMPYELQVILLRVLQDKRIMRLGGKSYRKVDFRLIAATNQDLPKMIMDRTFREDLYFRLSVLTVEIPPLCFRENDIIPLAEHFIRNYAKRMNRSVPELTLKAAKLLSKYVWPGNVRQLENSIIYAMNMSNGHKIDANDLPKELFHEAKDRYNHESADKSPSEASDHDTSSFWSMKDFEDFVIQKALEQTNNNVAEAAKILGISKTSIYRKIKK